MLDIDRLPGSEDGPRNPHMVRESDLGSSQTLPHLGIKFVRLLVVDEKSGSLRVKQSRDRPDDLGQQVAQLDLPRNLRNHAKEFRLLGLFLFGQFQQKTPLKGD